MSNIFAPRTTYTRTERISDGIVHVVGTLMALTAVPVLVTLAVMMRGDMATVSGVAIYGASLIAMLACSAAYNMAWPGAWDHVLRRMDHSAIYLKIAGTYTGFVLISGKGEALAVGIWVAALLGMGMKMICPDRFRWVGLALYIGMGWAGLVAGWPLFEDMSRPVLMLVVIGGLIYTLGVPFYLMSRIPFHITVWHGFVLTASAILFAAVMAHVITTASLAAAAAG